MIKKFWTGQSEAWKSPRSRSRGLQIRDVKASLDRPISQPCTARQFDDASYAYWCQRIGEAPRTHRKQWEFCYIAQVLASSGVLVPGRRGLGFGVGNEPLVAMFASAGPRLLATDQASDMAHRSGWVETEQHAAGKAQLNSRGLCDADLFDELVEFRFVDMNEIPVDIGSFDFVWSACAFEHLGSIAKGKEFILASSRLLEPGGVAVHTTEYNCSSDRETLDNSSTVLYRRRDFEDMGRMLAAEGFDVEITFDPGDGSLDRHIDVPPFSESRHLRLKLEDWITTSFGFVIRKP